MLILITYDVETTTVEGRKRLRQVARECVNYGHRVQNSVFECVLTEAQFIVLREKLKKLIDNSTDSIRFYFLGNNWERHIESIGLDRSLDTNSALIICYLPTRNSNLARDTKTVRYICLREPLALHKNRLYSRLHKLPDIQSIYKKIIFTITNYSKKLITFA